MQVDLYRQREREKKRKIRLGGFWFGNRKLLFGEKIALADVGGRWAMLAHGASFFLSLSLSVGILLHLFLLGGYQTISRKNFSTYRENR